MIDLNNYQPMKCGSCGCALVTLEALGNEPNIKKLRIHCFGCKNVTYVQLSSPRMYLTPSDLNADGGYHCVWL